MAASLTARFGIATGAYVDERDDWPSALARPRQEGFSTIELTAIRNERLIALTTLLADDPRALDRFVRVSVHAPARDFVDDPRPALESLRALQYDIVFHPDAHGGRLRQVHVSGIEADGTHRPTTRADLELYEPLLARCSGVPLLLEAELDGVAT